MSEEGRVKYRYTVRWADEELPEETVIATGAARLLEVNGEEVLSIVREDQKLYPWSPREFYERVLDIWEERTGVNGKPRVVTPADWKWSLEQALAELEAQRTTTKPAYHCAGCICKPAVFTYGNSKARG